MTVSSFGYHGSPLGHQRVEAMQTAKVFKLGNAQAVRIPARYRFNVDEVEVFKRGDELILRPKTTTAADVFARIREHGADWSDFKRPEQGVARPVPPLDVD